MPPVLRNLNDSPYAHRTEELIAAARDARLRACAPYSRFRVGAAVLTHAGKIYVGVNVECVDYDVTHAEESAFSAWVMGPSEPGSLPAMIVAVGAKMEVCGNEAPVIPPCGKCRQKIYEWIRTSTHDIDVIITDPVSGLLKLCSIRELLPLSF